MPKTIPLIIILIVLIFTLVVIYYGGGKPQPAPLTDKTEKITSELLTRTVNVLFLPLDKALERVTKKSFGIYITPKNSPVSPEKFTGYHTGADFEIFPGEENKDIQIFAICAGKLLIKEFGRGYGGMAVQSCNINNQPVAVVYGHLKLASIVPKVGNELTAGSVLGILGKGYTSETDYERKHLHLGIHKGISIDTSGYVTNESELNNWIDPLLVLK